MTETTIQPSIVEGEARVKDTDLATRLGFQEQRSIRKLIARHRVPLSRMGHLLEIEQSVGKGQKVKTFYLNRKQAIFTTAKSDTPEATDITIEIIHRFDALEKLARQPRPELPAFVAPRPWHERSIEQQRIALSTASHLARFGNHPLALNYLRHMMGDEYFPQHLMPAWHQHSLALETTFTMRTSGTH